MRGPRRGRVPSALSLLAGDSTPLTHGARDSCPVQTPLTDPAAWSQSAAAPAPSRKCAVFACKPQMFPFHLQPPRSDSVRAGRCTRHTRGEQKQTSVRVQYRRRGLEPGTWNLWVQRASRAAGERLPEVRPPCGPLLSAEWNTLLAAPCAGTQARCRAESSTRERSQMTGFPLHNVLTTRSRRCWKPWLPGLMNGGGWEVLLSKVAAERALW